MVFDNNIAYQTSRILISIFGTLGMVVTTSRIRENKMKNLLIVCGYVFYTIVFCYLCIRHFGFRKMSEKSSSDASISHSSCLRLKILTMGRFPLGGTDPIQQKYNFHGL